MSGVQSRRKMRVRVYGSLDGVLPPTTFAEIKHKVDGRKVKRRSKFVLAAAVMCLTAGALFLFLPGHTDVEFRRLLGVVQLVTGALWAASYFLGRRRGA